jgi:ATP-dependent RNA helicase MSS116, mitochondrial
MNVRLAVGGTSRQKLLYEINMGCDILVGTPGRLNDIIESDATTGARMKNMKVLIFDEADQLLDMGFKPDMMRISSRLANDRRTFMFSATLARPIREIAAEILSPGYTDIDTVPANETDTHLKIKQSSLVVPYKEHIPLLTHIVTQHRESKPLGKIIVFFQTTKMVQLMTSIFKQMNMDVMEIHSGLDQQKRTRVSARFRAARSAILFTTDVSARYNILTQWRRLPRRDTCYLTRDAHQS